MIFSGKQKSMLTWIEYPLLWKTKRHTHMDRVSTSLKGSPCKVNFLSGKTGLVDISIMQLVVCWYVALKASGEFGRGIGAACKRKKKTSWNWSISRQCLGLLRQSERFDYRKVFLADIIAMLLFAELLISCQSGVSGEWAVRLPPAAKFEHSSEALHMITTVLVSRKEKKPS